MHHVAILVTDLDRAERFYAGVLGLPVLRRHFDDAGAPRAVWLARGAGAFLALERGATAAPRDDAQAGLHCVALGIRAAEREAFRSRLSAEGFPVERETRYTLYARDPDGVLVGLSHFPDEAPASAPSRSGDASAQRGRADSERP